MFIVFIYYFAKINGRYEDLVPVQQEMLKKLERREEYPLCRGIVLNPGKNSISIILVSDREIEMSEIEKMLEGFSITALGKVPEFRISKGESFGG